jgi:hypothetical protein
MKTTFKHLFYILSFALYIFLSSCAVGQFAVSRPIERVTLVDMLAVSHPIDKIGYFPADRVFYLLNREDNTIRVYHRGEFFNIIGGTGFADDQFRRLSDIYVHTDGSLLALDSFERVIKRFDTGGRLLNTIPLSNISSPERLAFTSIGALFIYDSFNKEIYVLDPFDLSLSYNFGRFQIEETDEMFIAGDVINIHNRKNNETLVYFTSGMFDKKLDGLSFYEQHKNILTVTENELIDTQTENVLVNFVNTNRVFTHQRELLIFYDGTTIRVFRGVYQ